MIDETRIINVNSVLRHYLTLVVDAVSFNKAWLNLLGCIWVMSSSSPGRDTAYPDRRLSWRLKILVSITRRYNQGCF
jgi:hypothetical protein